MEIAATLAILLISLLSPEAFAYTVFGTETKRGEYEAGRHVPDGDGHGQFRYRFEVDEDAGKAKLTETVRLGNNSIIDTSVEYVIGSEADASAFSSLLASPDRRKQRVLILVGKPGSKAVELVILGEDFFEYCKASSSRFYLATGIVRKPKSVERDTMELLGEGLAK